MAFVALAIAPRVAWPQAGNPVGPEFQINTYTTFHQLYPSVSADPAGNFVVVWGSDTQDGPNRGVYGQRYAGGGAPQGAEFRVNTYTTGAQDDPVVDTDSAGRFVAIWTSDSQDGGLTGIFGQRYSSSGLPLGPEFRLNTYTASHQQEPAVAVDGSGNFTVVWQSLLQDGDARGIFGQRTASSGVPLGPEFRVNTYTTGTQFQPAVAADILGNFVVVWTSSDQDGWDTWIYGQRYSSSGSPLGAEFRVNTVTAYTQAYPTVSADSPGNFVVAWQSALQDGSSWGVFGQRYAPSGSPLGPEFRANSYTTDQQRGPSVATDPSGNFVIVWDSPGQDGAGEGVFGQRYASSGLSVGPEFRVNAYTTDAQFRPSVTTDSAGNFVIGWTSMGQDGSHFGVFGQRYGQIVPVGLLSVGVE